jgi:hypothetical protein
MRSHAVAAELERCRAWIEAACACSDGETTFEGVAAEVLANRAQLWGGDRSCVVTQLHSYQGVSFLFGWVCGGAMDEIVAMQPALESWARQQGATQVRVNLERFGWVRVFGRRGYVRTGDELVKVLR